MAKLYSEEDMRALSDKIERLERENNKLRPHKHVDGTLLSEEEKEKYGVGQGDVLFLSAESRSVAWPRG